MHPDLSLPPDAVALVANVRQREDLEHALDAHRHELQKLTERRAQLESVVIDEADKALSELRLAHLQLLERTQVVCEMLDERVQQATDRLVELDELTRAQARTFLQQHHGLNEAGLISSARLDLPLRVSELTVVIDYDVGALVTVRGPLVRKNGGTSTRAGKASFPVGARA